MNYLHSLGNNEENAKAVREYLINCLHKKAGDEALIGQSTEGYKQARDIINYAINQLVEEYGEKEKVERKNRL